MEPEWKRIVGFANKMFVLGELISKFYVQKYFPAQAKDKMDKLVDFLLLAMRERLNNLDWMVSATKQKALKKLSAFTRKIGYPDEFEDYSSLEITSDDSFFTMIQKCKQFHQIISFSRLYKEPNHKKWLMSPQTINAYFHPFKNEIVFPAAILQFPFFDPNMTDAENYGGIGAVIAHEITHGFDDKGSLFDAQGNMNNWWTKEDQENFKGKCQYFVEQYEKFMVNGKPLKGELTLGENIADHGGVKVSFQAYNMHTRSNDGNKTNNENLNDIQQFFFSYARIWRGKLRPKYAEQSRMLNPHSPPKARVNVTLANITEFHKAFNVSTEDKMYRSDIPPLW